MAVLRSILLSAPLFALVANSTAAEQTRPQMVAHRGLLRHTPENRAEVNRPAPDIPVFCSPVFWDRGANTNVDGDIRLAEQHGFASIVLQPSGITPGKAHKVKLGIGAGTVNDRATMPKLLDVGVERLYTDYPRTLLCLKHERQFGSVACEGTYPHHLQGICTDGQAIYWSFTTTLVKTDMQGSVQKFVPVANHHGDLCYHEGKLYIAVNLGKFNDPEGNADSWVYVYDAESLLELARHATQEVYHGAGGIGIRSGHFFVVGGLPAGVEENYVYEYDGEFAFQKKHVINSGHTLLGIQTATFAHDRWWFGCYGEPKILLVTDADFNMLGRYEFDCSLGIEGRPDGRLLSATGACDKEKGCTGEARLALPDDTTGLRLLHQP